MLRRHLRPLGGGTTSPHTPSFRNEVPLFLQILDYKKLFCFDCEWREDMGNFVPPEGGGMGELRSPKYICDYYNIK